MLIIKRIKRNLSIFVLILFASMKCFAAILLLGLLSVSFVGNIGMLSSEIKCKVEVSKDIDTDKEVKDQSEQECNKFITALNPIFAQYSLIGSQTNISFVKNLSHISYEVEIRPPRA